MCASATKQYNLEPASGVCWSVAGKSVHLVYFAKCDSLLVFSML